MENTHYHTEINVDPAAFTDIRSIHRHIYVFTLSHVQLAEILSHILLLSFSLSLLQTNLPRNSSLIRHASVDFASAQTDQAGRPLEAAGRSCSRKLRACGARALTSPRHVDPAEGSASFNCIKCSIPTRGGEFTSLSARTCSPTDPGT